MGEQRAGAVFVLSSYHGEPASPGPGERRRLHLCVEDDGPGIPDELREAVLRRGVRADTRLPGQGIGLAVVRETVEQIYGGSVEIDVGALGGTRVRIVV